MAQPKKDPKSGIWYLRRKVPDVLREALGREYKRSLKTQDANEAKARHAEEWIKCERAFALARAQLKGEMTYSRADAQQLAARWIRAEQERMDQSGAFASMLAQGSSTWIDTGEGMEEAISFDTLRTAANADSGIDLRSEAQKALERAMRREGWPVPPKGSASHQGLLNTFEEHLDKLSAWALERQYGEQVPRGVGVAPLAAIEAEKRAEAAAKPKVHTLGDLFGKYSEMQKLDDGAEPSRSTLKTLAEYKARVDDFIELHGNLDVRDIGRDLIAEHRGLIARLPSRGEGIRALMAPQLIEKADREGLKRLTPQTIRNRLRVLSAVFGYGVLLGWMHENPVVTSGAAKAAARAASKHQAAAARRKEYTRAELEIIFASPALTDKGWAPPGADFGKAWYWLPLLMYYTGGRREELAQLRVAEVRRDPDAGWHLSFLEKDDPGEKRTVKTLRSRRKVPLHPDLIERGFIAYLESQPVGGQLFPKLKPDAKGYYGGTFGRRWASYLRETVGLDSPARPSHGFRHTFKTLCREYKIPAEVSNAITGHTGEGGEGQKYGSMPLSRLTEEIKRFPVAPTR